MSIYDEPMDEEAHRASEIDAERAMNTEFDEALEVFADVVPPMWHYGDGQGGYVLERLYEAIERRQPGITTRYSGRPTTTKATISAALRKQVHERDAYRCVTCGDHHDLTCDHIVPESKGGPTTLENLQTMCQPCNSKKGARE